MTEFAGDVEVSEHLTGARATFVAEVEMDAATILVDSDTRNARRPETKG